MMKTLLTTVILLLWLLPASFSQTLLELREALETGLSNNFSIRLQKNDETIAGNNNTLGNAGFLPSVSVSVSQNNTINTTHQEQFSGTLRDVDNAKNNSLNLGLQVNWTIFDGMRMFVNRRMLGILEELGVNGTTLVMENFVADASSMYYAIVQTKKMVKVAKEALDLSSRRREIAEAKLKIGSGSQLMLMQSTVDQNADSTRLLQQMTLLENLKTDLNRLLGRDVLIPFDVADTITFLGIPITDSVFSLADRQNSQLAAARLRSDLARYEIKEAQADRYPKLSLNGSYAYSTLKAETGFLKQNQSYGPSYGISLSYNLFNGFNVTRAIQNARIMLNSSDLETGEIALGLRGTLAKLMNQHASNSRIVALQQENVVVAHENMNIAFEKYKLGSLNDLELREIQRKLIEADYELIAAQFEVKKIEIEISRYCGNLLKNAVSD